MQTSELPAAKAELEREIVAAINYHINRFTAAAGFGVSAISLRTMEITTLESARPEFRVTGVSVDLSI